MLIRLLFVVAEVCRSPRTLLLLGAHACQVVVTSTVIAVMCSLVETASRLGGEHAAVLRSFSTPGSVAAALCAMIVTGSASSAVHDALRSVRTPWRAAGVSPVLASVAIAAQVTVVNAASILTGLLLARAAVAATTNVSIVDAATSLRFGSPTVIGAVVLVGTALVPSAANAVRRPYAARFSDRRIFATVLLAIGGTLWIGFATWMAAVPAVTLVDVQRDVGFSLLALVTMITLVATTLARARRFVADVGARIVPDTAPAWIVLGTGATAHGLRRSVAQIAPVLVSVSLTGGTIAVFMVGDAASDRVARTEFGSTVNVSAIVLTLAPVLVICAAASLIAGITVHPSRPTDSRVLRTANAGLLTIVGSAVAEATTAVAVAAVASTALVAIVCLPMTVAAGVPLGALVLAVVNPVQVSVLCAVAMLLVTSSVMTTLAHTHSRLRRSTTR